MKTLFAYLLLGLCVGTGCVPANWWSRPETPTPPKPSEVGTGRPRPPAPVTKEQVTPANARAKADALRDELDREEEKETPLSNGGRKR